MCVVRKLINHFFSERKSKMSNENNVSKELTDAVNKVLSRRDAVKKAGSIAAGAALAFLGLGLPGISQQKEAQACCQWDCTGGCEGGCGSMCDGGCASTCWEVCNNSCEGCAGTCRGTCESTCIGYCSDDCSGSSDY